MSNTIKIKRSAVPGKIPAAGDLELGELAINTYDGRLFLKKDVGGTQSIVNVTAGGGGTVAPNVVTTSAATYNATQTDGIQIILCDTTSNNVTVTLPSAVSNTAIFHIKKIASANSMIIDPSGTETIDGGTTVTVTEQFESLMLVSNNVNWNVI